MAAGTYKNGVEIIVSYQAVGCATGKTITMSVYDEAHSLDAGKSGAMAEIGTTGRYWKAFTPDAEGAWIVMIVNTTDTNGNVMSQYDVCGHDLDEIGDMIAIVDGIVDDILIDTAEIGAAGAGLTNIDLPNQTMNITGNLTGSVGSVTGNVGGNVTGSVGSLATQAKADVEAECYDALDTAFDDSTAPNAGSIIDRIRTLCWLIRNKISVVNASGNTIIYKDNSTTEAFSVATMLTDDSTDTVRKRAE